MLVLVLLTATARIRLRPDGASDQVYCYAFSVVFLSREQVGKIDQWTGVGTNKAKRKEASWRPFVLLLDTITNASRDMTRILLLKKE